MGKPDILKTSLSVLATAAVDVPFLTLFLWLPSANETKKFFFILEALVSPDLPVSNDQTGISDV